MSRAPSTIGIDMGSSGIKGVLRSGDGRILASMTRATELLTAGPGEVVFSADRCYGILCDVLQSLVRSTDAGLIAAVTLSGATGDTVLLDGQGCPLLPAIHWMDTRTVNDETVDPPGMTPADVYRTSGWPWFRSFPLAHLAWLKTHQADIYQRAHRVGMNLTYQYYRLCGAWAMDYSTATTFYLQDQANRCWYQPYLDWLGLSASRLPQLHPTGICIGQVSRQAVEETGLPEGCAVVLGAFDHPCAARGTGVVRPGDVLLSLGTSWVGFYPVASREAGLRQNLLMDPFLSSTGGAWGVMFSLTKAGERLDESMRSSYPQAADVATRHSLVEADVHRLSSGAPAPSAAAALVDELIGVMGDKINQFSREGMDAERVVLAGGPSANAAIVDRFRRILGKPVTVAQSGGYSGALGAAMIAAKYCEDQAAQVC